MSAIYTSESARAQVERQYLEILKQWPVASESRRVGTRHGETFVVACGPVDGPALLLLQGSGANSAMWMADIAIWARDFRIYSVDVIGEPGLSAPNRPALVTNAYVEWLDDVLDALSLDQCAMVGVSLGGWLALTYATQRPKRVASLVLQCPSGLGRQRGSFMLKVLPLLLLGASGRRRVMKLMTGRTPPSRDGVSPQFLQLLATIQKGFRPRRERVPVIGDEKLAALTMPILLIVGALDPMLASDESAERLARVVPHATIRTLPDGGHILPRQTSVIHEFLKDS